MTNQENLTLLLLDKIQDSAESIKTQWMNPVGTTTRHFVIDKLLDSTICQSIYDAFPKDGNGFFNRESFREKKRTSADLVNGGVKRSRAAAQWVTVLICDLYVLHVIVTGDFAES